MIRRGFLCLSAVAGGAVMEVLKELRAAKITRIALMTQEETPQRIARR